MPASRDEQQSVHEAPTRPLRMPRWGRIAIASAVSALVAACGSGGDAGGAASGAAADTTLPLTVRAYTTCANCHLEHGRGMPPAYRTLVGSAWATGDPERAIAIVLKGIEGPVKDSTGTYYTAMLPYGSGAVMSDTLVAAAVTHIRTSWGNSASPVTVEDVQRVKAKFASRTKMFTQAELDAWGQ